MTFTIDDPTDRRQRRIGAVVLLGTMLLLFGLGGRLIYLNLSLRPLLLNIARRQQRGTIVLPARRGTIFDARGRVVASTRFQPDVFVDPSLVSDVDALSLHLGTRLNLSPGKVASMIRRRAGSRYVILSSRVDEVTAEAVRALHNPAVGLTDGTVRSYPLGGSMVQLLGFVGRDGDGLEGLERTFNDHLRGKDGRRSTIRDARKRALWKSSQGNAAAIDGGHLVLTIDAEVQRIAEDALEETREAFEAENGVAIVMVPSTGEVLAMAMAPLLETDQVSSETGAFRRNRAITDPVEPGSAFKPFIACGALAGGYVTRTEEIDCHHGVYRIGSRTIRDTSSSGELDIVGIITKSSNIGMSLIASRMGNEALYHTIRNFGFGEKTGIECVGEDRGLVYPLKKWTSYSTVSVSFGYEVMVTPLQLVTAYAALVNDGVLLQPRLVKQLLGPDGRVFRSFDRPQIVRRAIASDVARFMTHKALVSVVEHGGGRRAKTGRYAVLGKTGTAKLTRSGKRGYESSAYLGTFVGAAPAENPRIVVLVMIRRPNPKIGYYGGKVAAPAAGRILTETLSYLRVPANDMLAMKAP